MTTSLTESRARLVESTLSLLWRQWTLLGVPGQLSPEDSSDPRIIDPESLLLLTSVLGRFDARLLDEVTNWLLQYGRLINIQRLKGIHRQHRLGDDLVLSAIAATVLQNSRLAKWQTIQALAQPRTATEPLFRSIDGKPAPAFGKPDPFFARYGLFRGLQKTRDDASPPRVESPAVLLMKLRALFGINARAEIIATLLSTTHSHPSALARRTAYLPRSIQDTLNEMALSGHVVTQRAKGSREKYFSLRPNDWHFLITWPKPKFPLWTDWAVLFSLIQDATETLYVEGNPSQKAIALRFREIFDTHYPLLAEAGLAGHFQRTSQRSGTDFLDSFLAEIISLPQITSR